MRRSERTVGAAGDDRAREVNPAQLEGGDRDRRARRDLPGLEIQLPLGHQVRAPAAERTDAPEGGEIGDVGVHLQGELVHPCRAAARAERELHDRGRARLGDLGHAAQRPPGQLAARARRGDPLFTHPARLALQVERPRELPRGRDDHRALEHPRQAGRGRLSPQEMQVEGLRLDLRRRDERPSRSCGQRRRARGEQLAGAEPGAEAGHPLVTPERGRGADGDPVDLAGDLGRGEPGAGGESALQLAKVDVERRQPGHLTVDPGAPEAEVGKRKLDVVAAGRRALSPTAGPARRERSSQPQLPGGVLLQHGLRSVDAELREAHDHASAADQRADQREDVEPRAHVVEREHPPALGIEDLHVDAADPVDAEDLERSHGDPPRERRRERPVHPRLHEATRRREPEVEDRAPQQREREHDREPDRGGDVTEAHQKASPMPNASANGKPCSVPGSASMRGSVPRATWSPGIR